jgi:hypothetical protein
MAFPDGQQALIEKVMTQNPASAGFFVGRSAFAWSRFFLGSDSMKR